MLIHTPDDAVLDAQLGRRPRGDWEVVARCVHGRPTTIITAPLLDDGARFPTLYWLTCPWLSARVDGLESTGLIAEWRERLAGDPALAAGMLLAEEQYRARRAERAGGEDPCAGVGIAGQRDSSATKCIHTHVAAALAGIDDPIGAQVLADADPLWCSDEICLARVRAVGTATT